MKVDVSQSVYHESPTARTEFSRKELRYARFLLRRLRFLEQQTRERGDIAEGSGGAVFAELEVDALEWALGPECADFLGPKMIPARVSRNH